MYMYIYIRVYIYIYTYIYIYSTYHYIIIYHWLGYFGDSIQQLSGLNQPFTHLELESPSPGVGWDCLGPKTFSQGGAPGKASRSTGR